VGKAYFRIFLVGGTLRVTEVHQNSRCIRLKGRPLNSLSLLSATALNFTCLWGFDYGGSSFDSNLCLPIVSLQSLLPFYLFESGRRKEIE
jgi:hypothetical protein